MTAFATPFLRNALLVGTAVVGVLAFLSRPVWSAGELETKVKAAYVYHVLKFVEWPQAGDNLRLCVVGTDAVATLLPELNGKTFELRVCVVNGANQALEHVLDELRGNPNRWHFIEVMNCPGGCVNGGGQPLQGAGSSWLAPTTPLPVKL